MIIYKDGGCDKVTWTNCNRIFCWYWKGIHNNLNIVENIECFISRIFVSFISLIMLLLIIFKLYIQTPDLISEMQLYSEKIENIITWLAIFFCYLSTLSIELIFAWHSIIALKEYCSIRSSLSKGLNYIVLSVIYPVAWCYGFYIYFICW